MPKTLFPGCCILSACCRYSGCCCWLHRLPRHFPNARVLVRKLHKKAPTGANCSSPNCEAIESHLPARVAHANLPCGVIIERHHHPKNTRIVTTLPAPAMLLWPNFSTRIDLPGSILREDKSTRDERFSCRKQI